MVIQATKKSEEKSKENNGKKVTIEQIKKSIGTGNTTKQQSFGVYNTKNKGTVAHTQHISTYNYKVVFIVNSDLKMSKGKVVSQCMHAYDQLLENIKTSFVSSGYNSNYCRWKEEGNPKIILKGTQKQIESIYRKIVVKNNVNVSQVFDAGKTEVECGSNTVMGIGPDSVKVVDELVSHLETY